MRRILPSVNSLGDSESYSKKGQICPFFGPFYDELFLNLVLNTNDLK